MKEIAIHCSATPTSHDIGFKEINSWHKDNGWGVNTDRGYISCGYHYIIRRNGVIEKGRPDSVQGAHIAGHNEKTLGICMVGGVDNELSPQDNFTVEQYVSLKYLLKVLTLQYPEADVIGHNHHEEGKACPSFDYNLWLTVNNVEK